MKKELMLSVILGIVSLMIIGVIIANNTSLYTLAQSPQVSPATETKTFTLTDFTKHNSPTDCWIRMSQNVYDVSSYLYQHPGGVSTILPYCGGRDATDTFSTKGGRGAHSSRAEQLLQTLLIGTLLSQ